MKSKGKRILVVDDEPSIQRILRRNLAISGYEVLVAETGEQALEMVRINQPDLILLDLWLPGEIDGIEVCTQVPFNNEELLARVRACLRRVANVSEGENAQQPEILTSEDGYLSMNVVRRQVRAGSQEVKLTPTEFELLRQLMLHAGKVLTHRALLRAVWGPEYGEEADYLRVYVRQLRLKIEVEPSQPRYILTEPGVGYVFHPQVQTESNGATQSLASPTTLETEAK